MTPEQERKLDEVIKFMNALRNSTSIPYDVDGAFRKRLFGTTTIASLGIPGNLANAPLDSISAPTGGATVDLEARAAANLIITRMEDLGLIDAN